MPLSAGMAAKNFLKASNPPAEAPMPATGGPDCVRLLSSEDATFSADETGALSDCLAALDVRRAGIDSSVALADLSLFFFFPIARSSWHFQLPILARAGATISRVAQANRVVVSTTTIVHANPDCQLLAANLL
jgi:hypothetical protein